jgi:hypothetical protein
MRQRTFRHPQNEVSAKKKKRKNPAQLHASVYSEETVSCSILGTMEWQTP